MSSFVSDLRKTNLTPPLWKSGRENRVRTVLCIGLVFWLAWEGSHLAFGQVAELTFRPSTATDDLLDVTRLKQIEAKVLPPVVKPGSPRFRDLPEYYWAENQDLRDRLEFAKDQYELGNSRPYRALTLIAGSAGVGKTFIKQKIFSNDYPADAICKFDVKELFEDWRFQELVEARPDLHCGNIVLNKLPAVKPGQPRLMQQFLEAQSASFFVIDSLDEIHPDDYVPLLRQIEQFVIQSQRDFLHVVVLGRPLAFRDYWHARTDPLREQHVSLFMLHPPRFLTTGDLMVSSWNYHTWRYQLQWQSESGATQTMAFDAYTQWADSGYPDSLLGRPVIYQANQNMDPRVRNTILAWAENYRVVNSMLANLAGNGILREIAERFTYEQQEFDERLVMEAYLAKWLERDTKREDRPSATKPEHLDLYMRLLQTIAVKYLQTGHVDSNGFFTVNDDDHIELVYQGRQLQFPVSRILDRSGLKYLDPRQPGTASYRFEPIWFHRLLVEMHNDTIREATKH